MSLLQSAYLSGYRGSVWPRFLRRMIAGTCLHRAWLLGHLGFFSEGGIAYGPARPYSEIVKEIADDTF